MVIIRPPRTPGKVELLKIFGFGHSVDESRVLASPSGYLGDGKTGNPGEYLLYTWSFIGYGDGFAKNTYAYWAFTPIVRLKEGVSLNMDKEPYQIVD